MVIFTKFCPIFILTSFIRASILKREQRKIDSNKNTNQIVPKKVKVAVILQNKPFEN